MTVAELITELQKMPQEKQVVLSCYDGHTISSHIASVKCDHDEIGTCLDAVVIFGDD